MPLAIRAAAVPGASSVARATQRRHVVAFNSHRPTSRTKIKRRIKEAIRLIVTRGGAAVEESSGATPRVVLRADDVGAEMWIVPGASSMRLLGEVSLRHTSPFPQPKCSALLIRYFIQLGASNPQRYFDVSLAPVIPSYNIKKHSRSIGAKMCALDGL